jgi:hypothetical protein
MYGFGADTKNPKSEIDIRDFINPEFPTTTKATFNFANYAGLAKLAGFGNLLDRMDITTTTKSSGFNLGNLFGASTGTGIGASSNTLLSILSLLSGSGAGASSLASITPFLSLLPLDQLFPSNNLQANLGLISSLPQIINLIQSFNNFKLPVSNVNIFYSIFQLFMYLLDEYFMLLEHKSN